MLDNLQYFFIFLGIILVLIILFTFSSIKKAILSIFGGSIDKVELGGIVFTILFVYMIIKEGNRDHEWTYYNELYIFFTAGAAMTGLGLSKVLDTIKEIKSGNSNVIKNNDEQPE